MPKKYSVDASNALVLIQDASSNSTRNVPSGSTLSLVQTGSLDKKLKLTSSDLLLTQDVATSSILYIPTSNSLTLSDSVIRQGTTALTVSSTLDLTDEARSTLKYAEASNQLDFQQQVDVRQPILASAYNSLSGDWADLDPEDVINTDPFDPEEVAKLFEGIGLRQEVILEGSSYNLSVTSYLSFSQEASNAQFLTASNYLPLQHTAETVEYEVVTNTLRLQQSVDVFLANAAGNSLNLTQSVVAENLFYATVSSSLNLKNIVSYGIINFCGYTPGVGEGDSGYTPPPTAPPILVRRESTVLTWPYTAPTLSVELRNPNFDNVEQFEFRRINRRTRGGTLDLYRDESWPKLKRLIYSFSWLSDSQRVDLLDFLNRSLGQEIGILDFESRQWRGVILTPSSAISEPKRNGHSITLEFEGELA